jgi:hypothetical protein
MHFLIFQIYFMSFDHCRQQRPLAEVEDAAEPPETTPLDVFGFAAPPAAAQCTPQSAAALRTEAQAAFLRCWANWKSLKDTVSAELRVVVAKIVETAVQTPDGSGGSDELDDEDGVEGLPFSAQLIELWETIKFSAASHYMEAERDSHKFGYFPTLARRFVACARSFT